jgi:hypothetical protein
MTALPAHLGYLSRCARMRGSGCLAHVSAPARPASAARGAPTLLNTSAKRRHCFACASRSEPCAGRGSSARFPHVSLSGLGQTRHQSLGCTTKRMTVCSKPALRTLLRSNACKRHITSPHDAHSGAADWRNCYLPFIKTGKRARACASANRMPPSMPAKSRRKNSNAAERGVAACAARCSISEPSPSMCI